MMWILYFAIFISIILVEVLDISAQDIHTLISALKEDGTPVIEVFEGDTQEWTDTLKTGGSWDTILLTGLATTTLYKKVAFHYDEGKVVYSNGKAGDISTFSLVDSIGGAVGGTFGVHSYTSVEIGGITIDWVSNNIYWTDQVYNWILMSPLKEDVNSHYTVIDTELDKPGGIAVHPATSWLFWTDYGESPKIERSNLLGDGRTSIVLMGLVTPTDLNIDYSTSTLYWLDTGISEIFSCDFDGGNVKSFLQNGIFSTMTGFTLDNTLMLGVSDSRKELYIIDKADSANYNTVSLNYDQIYDVEIDSPNRQPEVNSHCASVSCSFICVTSNNNTDWQCVCPAGYNVLSTFYCQASSYIEGPRYVYTLSNALCRYPVWTPVMTDEELGHNCLTDFVKPSTYYVGHLYEMKYLYVAYDNIVGKVVMQEGSSFVSKQLSVGNVKGFVVDWISQNIYWTNEEVIIVFNTDMDYPYELFRLTGLNGLAVDPRNEYLYYSCVVSTSYIGRAFLNGTSQSIFVTESLGKPEQLVIDYHGNRLYWTDSLLDRIESIQLDGTGRMTIVTMSNSHPFGIAVFQDHLVWTDQSSNESGLHWTYKDGTSAAIRSVLKAETTGTILLFGEYSQPIEKSMANFSTNDDLSTITVSGAALIFIDTLQRAIFQMDLETTNLTSIPVTGLNNPVAIDIDPEDELIFWTDVIGKTIKRSTISGENETVIKYLPSIAVPDGLAVDKEAKLIIYTDTGEDVIVRMDYNGGSEMIVITSLDEPRAIALDFDNRMMYWTDWGAIPKIEAATYDGNSRRTLVKISNIVWPNGLTIDRKEQTLYWCNANPGRLESIKTDGTDRKLLYANSGTHFFGIVFFEDYLYTTSWTSASIQRIHKDGGSLLNIGDPVLQRAYGITAYRYTDSTNTTTTTTMTSTTTSTTSSTTTSTTTVTMTTSEDGISKTTKGSSDGNKSSQTNGVNPNIVIITAVVASAVVLIIVTLTLGIYCCTKKRRNQNGSDNTQLHVPHLEARAGSPPPYTFTNEAFKLDGNSRPMSSIYDTIPENPYEIPVLDTSSPKDDLKPASSEYCLAQGVSHLENPEYAKAKDNGGYIRLYQPNSGRQQFEGISDGDYIHLSHLAGTTGDQQEK